MAKFKLPNSFNKNNTVQLWHVTNPWTGDSVVLTTIQKDMYVEIKELEKKIYMDSDHTASNLLRNKRIREFDQLRSKFRQQWSNEYMTLLD